MVLPERTCSKEVFNLNSYISFDVNSTITSYRHFPTKKDIVQASKVDVIVNPTALDGKVHAKQQTDISGGRSVIILPFNIDLSRFSLIKIIGDGAFSTVFKAIDKKNNFIVALKVVAKKPLDEKQQQNIIREATLLSRISHVNITQLVSFQESEEYFLLALEFVEGGELFQNLVDNVYFSESVSRHIVHQVGVGLRYLHEIQGVVHRDIKLENLLYEPFDEKLFPQYSDSLKEELSKLNIGTIKIADFGLSKVIYDSSTRTPCGTVGYTAPEIIKDNLYSKGVDIWALGCVLYTLLCGFPPFFGDDIKELTRKVAKAKYEFLSPWWDEISPAAKDLVVHMMDENSYRRFTVDDIMNHWWIRLLNFSNLDSIDLKADHIIVPVASKPNNKNKLISPIRLEIGNSPASKRNLNIKTSLPPESPIHRIKMSTPNHSPGGHSSYFHFNHKTRPYSPISNQPNNQQQYFQENNFPAGNIAPAAEIGDFNLVQKQNHEPNFISSENVIDNNKLSPIIDSKPVFRKYIFLTQPLTLEDSTIPNKDVCIEPLKHFMHHNNNLTVPEIEIENKPLLDKNTMKSSPEPTINEKSKTENVKEINNENYGIISMMKSCSLEENENRNTCI